MKAKTSLRALALLLPFLGLMLVAGAASADATIADIVAHPDVYDGATVTIAGTVAEVMPVGTESAYNLNDGKVRLTVISRTSAPPLGARLVVTGTVRHFTEGDDREANDFPPVLVESTRAPAP